jgi:hypothetical protein
MAEPSAGSSHDLADIELSVGILDGIFLIRSRPPSRWFIMNAGFGKFSTPPLLAR